MYRPYDHIVLVSVDTLRADCLAVTPVKLWLQKYPGLTAPNTTPIDQLAESGAFFPHVLSAAPYTSASHATYFTGRWPIHHGLHEFFNGRLCGDTLFTFARMHGLRTSFKVDFPVILGPYLGFDRDVDLLIEDDDEFLRRLSLPLPSLDFAHFGGAHIPYGFHNLAFGGNAYVDKVEELESQIPRSYSSPKDQLFETYRTDEDFALLMRYKRVIQYHYEARDYPTLFGLYLEGVEHFIQHRLGRFLERLLEVLHGRNYLLVLFSDHGEEYDADSYGHHNTLSDGVLRVPVIFYGPDVPAKHHPCRVRTLDIAPTLIDRQFGPTALRRANVDGESLADTIWGNADYPLRQAFAQAYTSDTSEFVAFQRQLFKGITPLKSLRHVRYKEAIYDGKYKATRQKYEYVGAGGVFDLRERPSRTELYLETEQGIQQPINDTGTLQRLLARLDWYNSHLDQHNDRPNPPADLRAQLRAIGYYV